MSYLLIGLGNLERSIKNAAQRGENVGVVAKTSTRKYKKYKNVQEGEFEAVERSVL